MLEAFFIVIWMSVSYKISILYSQIESDIMKDFCQTPVLGLGLGVDFTFAWDNHRITITITLN